MKNVLKDIKSGALPVGEIPGFVAWSIGRSFWMWLVVIVVGVVVMAVK